jgi:uncharacterized protein (DUF2336 family)
MASEAQSLIIELDAAVGRASNSWRSELLRRVTDLLVADVGSYSDHQIAIFGDIMGRMIENVETPALIELSARLAPLSRVPMNVITSLGRNDDMAVAGPVLEFSSTLSDDTLIDIARTKWPNQLAAIAGREGLTETITDLLVDRGNADVMLKLISNHSARISELGFVRLIGQAKTDKTIAAAIAARTDLPAELTPFLKLTLS